MLAAPAMVETPADVLTTYGDIAQAKYADSLATAKTLKAAIDTLVADGTGDVIATTAPRAGQTLFWKAATLELLGSRPIADGCGVAAAGEDGFIVSDGHGAFSVIGDVGSPVDLLARPPGYAWDNHMHAIGTFSS